MNTNSKLKPPLTKNLIEIGTKVIASDGKFGIVRYVGETEFAQGEWVGIELEKPDGKNNGVINGKTYFRCKPNYGLFIKKSQAKVYEEDESITLDHSFEATNKEISPKSDKEKSPPTGLRKPPSTSSNSRMNTSNLSEEMRKLKSEIKSKNEEIELLKASLKTSKEFVAGRDTSNDNETRANEIKVIREEMSKISTQTQENFDRELKQVKDGYEQKILSLESTNSKQVGQIAELDSELKSMRSRQEKLIHDDRKSTEEIVQLKAKVSSLQRVETNLKNEIMELKDMFEVMALEKETLETDKEIAEERIEELEALVEQSKTTRLVSNDFSLDRNDERKDTNVDEIADQNEKLKEALKIIHDQSLKEKQDLTRQIRQYEKDLQVLEKLKEKEPKLISENETLRQEKLELQEMLDVANVYEEMVESLTEKNLQLGDKVQDLESNVQTLESLKEMAEEMEEQHNEYERELQEDLEKKQRIIDQHEKIITDLNTAIEDQARTIEQFRKLVQKDQYEIMNLKQQLSKEKSELYEIRGQTQAKLTENISLKTTVEMHRQREMTYEYQTLQVEQLQQQLIHMKACLPYILYQKEEEALNTRLKLIRILSKLEILNRCVSNQNGISIDQIIQSLNDDDHQEMSEEVKIDRMNSLIYVIQMKKSLQWLKYCCNLQQFCMDCYKTTEEEYVTYCNHFEPFLTRMEVNVDSVIEQFYIDGSLKQGTGINLSNCDKFLQYIKIMKSNQFKEIFPFDSLASSQGIMKIKGKHYTHECDFSITEIHILFHIAIRVMKGNDMYLPLMQPFGEVLLKIDNIKTQERQLMNRLENDLSTSEDDLFGYDAIKTSLISDLCRLAEREEEMMNQFKDILDNQLCINNPTSILMSTDFILELRNSIEVSFLQPCKQIHLDTTSLYKSACKGHFTEDLTSVRSEEISTSSTSSISPWLRQAQNIKNYLSNAKSLQETLNQIQVDLIEKQKECSSLEKEKNRFKILKEKFEADFQRISIKIEDLNKSNEEYKQKIQKERDQFENALDQLHCEKDSTEEEVRQLKKQISKAQNNNNNNNTGNNPPAKLTPRRSMANLKENIDEEENRTNSYRGISDTQEMISLQSSLSIYQKLYASSQNQLIQANLKELDAYPIDPFKIKKYSDHEELSMNLAHELNTFTKSFMHVLSSPKLINLTASNISGNQQLVQKKLSTTRMMNQYAQLKQKVSETLVQTLQSQAPCSFYEHVIGNSHVNTYLNENFQSNKQMIGRVRIRYSGNHCISNKQTKHPIHVLLNQHHREKIYQSLVAI